LLQAMVGHRAIRSSRHPKLRDTSGASPDKKKHVRRDQIKGENGGGAKKRTS